MIGRTPTAVELLDAWERGLGAPPPARGLALLAPACPDLPPAALAALSIGRRDAALLALREAIFGPRLLCVVRCPACGEAAEVEFAAAAIRVEPPPDEGPTALATGGWQLRLRPPATADLVAVAGADGGADARLGLLRRCLVEARRGERPVGAEELPPEVVAAAAAALADADPQADVRLALECPSCAHGWSASFDIARHLWAEVGVWARRLLAEVHTLAAAYGWSERAIVAMGAARRGLYLEMVGR